MKVIIIGSGIGGLTAAIALRKAGFNVKVYERAAQLTEVGAGISLWANAFYAFDQLGIGNNLRAACQHFERGEIRVQRGHKPVGCFTAQSMKNVVDTAPMIGIIHRAELVGLLVDQLPQDCIQFGANCIDVAQSDGQVIASFTGGMSACGDLLVGADGIRSVVRAKLLGDVPVRYSGYTCYRGISNRPAAIDSGYVGEWWGRGQRVGIASLTNNRIYWWATVNAPANTPVEDPARELSRLFADWAEPLPDILRSTPQNSIIHNDIVDRPPTKRWSDGRIVLMGDAAHPTTPNLGQGGCMAIEDAVELPTYLASGESVEEALKSFCNGRYARTTAITHESHRMGAVGQWDSLAACWCRDRTMALVMRLAGRRHLPSMLDIECVR